MQIENWSWWQILIGLLIPFILGWLIGALTKTKGQEFSESKHRDLWTNPTTPKENDHANREFLQQQKLELETQLVECTTRNLSLQRKMATLESMTQVNAKTEISQHSKTIVDTSTTEVTGLEVKKHESPDVKNEQKEAFPQDNSSVDEKERFAQEMIYKEEAFQRLKEDQLQIFEGLGPKMEEFLRSVSVRTWSELAKQDSNWLKAKLEELDPKYRILQTDSWPIQAAMARDGQWLDLIKYQKSLSVLKSKEGTQITESKVEKMLYKLGILRKYSKDDLKAIEGIGPKIELLLHNSGIWTWGQLAIFDVKGLNSIIERAGERYQLADPSTWPKQAKLANEGKFKELIEYQRTLKGGIEKTNK